MEKAAKLRSLLQSSDLEFLMESHSALSAKIVQDAGFKGIWASGLSMSAALGLRDNNEASWTQILENVEFMSDATSIPILLDGDTGYGNFNNFRRLVRKLEQRGIAGVCIEDKIFPKSNSFTHKKQPLASIDEFCGKIKAGKDHQMNDDFCVVARVEAFISGMGLEEALKRGAAYYEAGADAVLIHSKQAHPNEILGFMKEWADRCPVVIVPTKYYKTPVETFRSQGVSMVIWANHILRSSITAMQKTATEVYKSQSLMSIEPNIASLGEVFQLQNIDELIDAEKRYFKRPIK